MPAKRVVRKNKSPRREARPPALQALRTTFQSILGTSEDDLYVVDFFACILASVRLRPGTELNWGIVYGVPGCGKTEHLRPFFPLKKKGILVTVDDATSKALVSGWVDDDGSDKSILPQLEGKTLVVKDMGTMQSKDVKEANPLMGLLRAAHDQDTLSRAMGTTGIREHSARFGILGCAVPEIQDWLSKQQVLGERFLLFHMGRNRPRGWTDYSQDRERMKEAASKPVWRAQLRDTVCSIFLPLIEEIHETWEIPGWTDPDYDRISSLARILVRGRTIPRRGGRPPIDPENHNRAMFGLQKLGGVRAFLMGRQQGSSGDIAFLARVTYDSLPWETKLILPYLAMDAPISTDDLCRRTGLDKVRAREILSQFVHSDLAIHPSQRTWAGHPELLQALQDSKLLEQAPPKRNKIR